CTGDRTRVVADGGATHDVHADAGQLAREMRGVRVDRETEEQFVADRHYFDGARRWNEKSHQRDGDGANRRPKLRRESTSEKSVSTTAPIIVSVPTRPLNSAKPCHAGSSVQPRTVANVAAQNQKYALPCHTS